MAYVRRRGNQLAIVQGERVPATGKARQRILFTLCSKAEALEALGRGEKNGREWFRHRLEAEYPDVKFNWEGIWRAIERNLDGLPDLYPYRSERLRAGFREVLCAFTRGLILANPHDLISAAHLIQEQHHELEYIVDLIKWRLKFCDQEQSEWNVDNPFYWRFALPGCRVPDDAEEHAVGLYERGDYERAEAVFRLLIECFDHYAEGYNYLGLIALDRGKLDEAVGHFEKTVELGRRLFPVRFRKKRYWSDLLTRPYMRGLRNLALTLNQMGRFSEALTICDRLRDECDDDWSSTWHRATVYLNTRRWQEGAEAAQRFMGTSPESGFIVAFAVFELGRAEDALSAFLYAALNRPRAARILVLGVAKRASSPKSPDEVEDHNAGVSLLRALHAYLGGQSRASRQFFRRIMSDARVVGLIDEVVAVVRRRREQHARGEREAFERMQMMHSREFANAEARKLRDLAAADSSRAVGGVNAHQAPPSDGNGRNLPT